ncbi:hypothetical protein V2J09_015234 [Rumex salicifolius]
MGLLQSLFITTCSILILFLNLANSYATTNGSISSWCTQTPYPNQCQHYIDLKKVETVGGGSGFLSLVVESALRASLDAHISASALGPRCHDARQKAAWSDCLELYELAAQTLNQVMTDLDGSHDDTQTWLSSVLTHFETCKSGFDDLGAKSDQLLPLMGYPNTSYLISNALALNNKQIRTQTRTENRAPKGLSSSFPRWVKGGDRRLLETSVVADIVVAQDGSGDYKTVVEGVNAVKEVAKKKGSGRTVIYVKAGVYKEYVSISINNVMLTGDGIGKTVITGSKSVAGGFTTFRSATVGVTGSNFIAKGITFQNTAGAGNNQAVALRSGSDLSVFYQCSFEGYQDTLYVYANRQFYRDCNVYGTVDFIFGNAAVVFQGCNLYPRRPPNLHNTITAQARTDPNQNTGISIISSTVKSAGDSLAGVKTYLGRPWQKYACTVFMDTYLDGIVDPAGWTEWSGNFALDTLYYGEYSNSGPGSSTSGRVKWKGFHVITSADEAGKFTVANLIAGDNWLPNTGVPFASGLSA